MRGRSLLLVLPLLLACPRGGDPVAPGEGTPDGHSRGQDARGLPAFGAGPGASDEKGTEAIERYHVTLGDAPARGPADAAVTVVMFSDFECPYCQVGHELMDELRRRHGSAVRVAYKAFPLDMHPHALLAAMAARSAQAQGKFWEFHDLLFSQRGLDFDTLLSHARAAKLDLQALRKDLEQLEYGPEVSRDLRQGRRLGVHSTPTFFINGRLLAGAQPIENFEAVIAEELALVEGWREQGVPPEQTYEHAIADGYRKVVYTEGRDLDPDLVAPVPLGTSPRLGPDDAPVTIVVFGDFECPFCARGNDTITGLLEHYGGKLRVVYKHSPLPFHSHAYVAARASVAAQAQGKFWEFHDALYRKRARFDQDDLQAIAKEIGLDMKKFRKAMETLELDRAIEQDQALAMSLGVSGTPAYFINGRPVQGAQPELVFRLMIEEELDRAAAAVRRGVAGGELYETLTHTPLDDAPGG
ncbi:DsbA family protein [Paraliomyxa miuraensis]|uniref:DsbA family protein n=1 Tax=Paraliomyxa miuraensis TaxID=376150 RepID=UPI00224EB279|nr:thioredoxin domain-containing protein [Paraliomyxa miuraensis]MCX4241783.1 thioredoxin domain-containing protein [Paraliomyxa miuraensis]